jgi:hypothetical protein
MYDEARARRQVMALLKHATKEEIGRELDVSGQAVKNWAEGKHVSERRWRQILALFEIDPETQQIADNDERAAPPEWARRLAVRLRAHSGKLKVSDEDLAQAEIEEAAEWAVGEEVGKRPQRRGGDGQEAPTP